MAEETFSWTFKEFDQHTRGVWWYCIAGGVVALAVLYSVQTGNFLFAVIIALTLVIIFARQLQVPSDVMCELSREGIRVGSKAHSFKDFDTFSIVQREDDTYALYLREARGLRGIISLPLVDIKQEPIRMFLLQFLDEDIDHQREPLWDWLMRALRL